MARRHRLAVVVTALLSAANVAALALLVLRIFGGRIGGSELLLAAAQIWTFNVLVFGLWYWLLDGGGPARRAQGGVRRDFAFAQMTVPALAAERWEPRFVDYAYLSFTNASAFSPSDTVPLTADAKLLLLVQSSISIVTLILVAARAVNML